MTISQHYSYITNSSLHSICRLILLGYSAVTYAGINRVVMEEWCCILSPSQQWLCTFFIPLQSLHPSDIHEVWDINPGRTKRGSHTSCHGLRQCCYTSIQPDLEVFQIPLKPLLHSLNMLPEFTVYNTIPQPIKQAYVLVVRDFLRCLAQQLSRR